MRPSIRLHPNGPIETILHQHFIVPW